MKITFNGDWSRQEVEAIAPTLRKSLALDDAIDGELLPPIITTPGKLSKKQRKLLELLAQAGEAVNDCDDPDEWDEYDLSKTAIGAQKVDAKGRRYIFNNKHRWQKLGGGATHSDRVLSPGDLQFRVNDGEFGEGVYMAIARPQGNLKVRLRVDATPDQIILQDRFEEIEQDLAIDLDMALDAANVRGVVKVEDEPVEIMVRSPRLITPLGIISGSGDGVGDGAFNVVNLEERPDHIILDIEFIHSGEPLEKAARKTLPSRSHLDGAKLIPTSPALDRALIRSALKQCLCTQIRQAQVSLLKGVPDFLPPNTAAFCLPSDRTIHLCPHDPQQAIAHFNQRLGERLKHGVNAGAIAPDDALNILIKSSCLDSGEWIKMLLKRFCGAIAIYEKGDIDSPIWASYLRLLAGRGVQFWGNRRSIMECMAEDYRCIHDPEGLPNLVTLEWDLACPAIGRMCQQVLATILKQDDG